VAVSAATNRYAIRGDDGHRAMVTRLLAEVVRLGPEPLERVVSAIAEGVRDEHDVRLVMAALGWREDTPSWARVTGDEELRDLGDEDRLLLEARVRASALRSVKERSGGPGGCTVNDVVGDLDRVDVDLDDEPVEPVEPADEMYLGHLDAALALAQLLVDGRVEDRWSTSTTEVLFQVRTAAAEPTAASPADPIAVGQSRSDAGQREQADVVGASGGFWWVVNTGYTVPRAWTSDEVMHLWPRVN
jgi:hypothetical protein